MAYANFVFTGTFALEMTLKLIGLGPWRYLSDAWNLFDALVVAFSLVELVTELMARSNANGLSALRWGDSLQCSPGGTQLSCLQQQAALWHWQHAWDEWEST